MQSSQPHMTFSPPHGSTTSMPSTISRLRGTSLTFPPGLDLRNQYRALPTHLHSPHSPATTRGGSFNSAFTGGYASAPLTVPVEFSLPRTPGDGGHGNRDFNVPQLSAPMAPPPDFSSAYSDSNLSPVRAAQESRDFSSQSQNNGDSGAQTRNGSQGPGSEQGQNQQQRSQQHNQQSRSQDDSYLRSVDYETGHKRKRSFTLPGGTYESP
jgi:hypothetical protein